MIVVVIEDKYCWIVFIVESGVFIYGENVIVFDVGWRI